MFGEESAVCPDKLLHLPVFLFQEKKCSMPSLFQFFHLEKLFLEHRVETFFPQVLRLDWDHSTAEESFHFSRRKQKNYGLPFYEWLERNVEEILQLISIHI